MISRKFLLVISLLLSFGFIASAQQDSIPLSTVIQKTAKFQSSYPIEKVYLHLDKPYYAIGDEIWFKAYVTAGPRHQLSALSKVLNVELINDNDSIKRAFKIPLTLGLGWGDIKLTDSLKEGNYRIRAYTNWMRNAGDE